MKKIKVFLFLLVMLTSFHVVHEYYLSTTTLKWFPAKQQLQITSRFFLDDIEALMQEKTDQKVVFLPDSNLVEIDAFVKKFYLDNLSIKVDESPQAIQYLGREYKDDLLVVYAEIILPTKAFQSINVHASFLIDFLNNQQNIIHLRSPNQKKSFLLTNQKTDFKFEVQ
jgi:hypothetical protein